MFYVENLKVGDKVKFVGDLFYVAVDFTLGKLYEIVKADVRRFNIYDDVGAFRSIPIASKAFVPADSPDLVAPKMDKLSLDVGDLIRYKGSRSFTYNTFLKVNDVCTIAQRDNDPMGRVVYTFYINGAKLLWHPQGEGYQDAFEPVQMDAQSTSLAHDDYLALIDLALDTDDLEWFNAIVEEMNLKGETIQ